MSLMCFTNINCIKSLLRKASSLGTAMKRPQTKLFARIIKPVGHFIPVEEILSTGSVVVAKSCNLRYSDGQI